MTYHMQIPATSANLGPGFDVLGLALQLHLELEARPASHWSLDLHGEGADSLPRDQRNLMVRAYQSACRQQGWKADCFALTCHNPIPTNRGLGSSAAALVAGISLAFLHHQGSLDRVELTRLAATAEGHPDNVAPAVWGGLQRAVSPLPKLQIEAQPLHPGISLLLVVPATQTQTRTMRQILPSRPDRETLRTTEYLLGRVLRGLAEARPEDLACSSMDVRHQPYRLAAQPLSRRILELLAAEHIGCGPFLSGSGPTVGCWILDDSPLDRVETLLGNAGIQAEVLHLQPDAEGVAHD